MKSLLKLLPLFFSLFPFSGAFPQVPSTAFELKGLPEQGIMLNKGWQFQAGDNPEWAKPGFNDSHWQPMDPTKTIHQLPELRQAQVGWFRLKLHVNKALQNKTIALIGSQVGASEIYFNGSLVARFGTVSADPTKEVTYNPYLQEPVPLHFSPEPMQVIAVRYSLSKGNLFKPSRYPVFEFHLTLFPLTRWQQVLNTNILRIEALYLASGVCLVMFILHFFLYLTYRERKVNLYLSLFTFFQFLTCATSDLNIFSRTATGSFTWEAIMVVTFPISWIFYLLAVYGLFHPQKDKWFTLLVLLLLLIVPVYYATSGPFFGNYMNSVVALVSARILFLSISAVRSKVTGTKIFLVGQTLFILFLILLTFNGYTNLSRYQLNIYIWIISELFLNTIPPIYLSIVLAWEVAQTNRTLKLQLIKVEKLSQKNLLQEKEKQEILATQNERLEQQVTQRTTQLKQSLEHLQATQTQLIQSEKMASLGELTAGIAHEIQNPLNFVNNSSDVNTELIAEIEQGIQKGNIEEVKAIVNDLKENEQKINQHGKRADSIVKGMLQHSRANAGEKQLTDINALAEEYLRLSYHGLRAKDKDFNAHMITDFDSSMGKVELVPQELGRVLLNLFNNAFYATQQKKVQLNGQYQPEIRVSTRLQERKIEIKVRDNGNGIPEGVKSKIFQPFFTTKPTGQGTGLGLSLSYDIITKGYGGELKVVTKEGEFAEFCITLPI